MSQYDLMLDLKIKVGHCDPYFMVSDFASYFEGYLMYKHDKRGLISQYDLTFYLKIKMGHCDLYFMVQ